MHLYLIFIHTIIDAGQGSYLIQARRQKKKEYNRDTINLCQAASQGDLTELQRILIGSGKRKISDIQISITEQSSTHVLNIHPSLSAFYSDIQSVLNVNRGDYDHRTGKPTLSNQYPSLLIILIIHHHSSNSSNIFVWYLYILTPLCLALHLAASEGHFECVRFLVEYGANVNVADRFGRTPLDDTIPHFPQITEYLLKQGYV